MTLDLRFIMPDKKPAPEELTMPDKDFKAAVTRILKAGKPPAKPKKEKAKPQPKA